MFSGMVADIYHGKVFIFHPGLASRGATGMGNVQVAVWGNLSESASLVKNPTAEDGRYFHWQQYRHPDWAGTHRK